jgi:hypothetical protein
MVYAEAQDILGKFFSPLSEILDLMFVNKASTNIAKSIVAAIKRGTFIQFHANWVNSI